MNIHDSTSGLNPTPYEMPTEKPDRVTLIASWLRLFVEPTQIVEVRIPKRECGNDFIATYGGYWEGSKLRDLAWAALNHENKAPAIYFSLNPLKDYMLAVQANKIARLDRDHGAKSTDVLRRRYLLVDVDPVRPGTISATDAEKAFATEKVQQIKDFLNTQSWSPPIVGDSGNGGHLLYRIDEPALDEGLIHRVLIALAKRFDDERAKVDVTVHDPNRICKIPGTKARKGSEIPGRPHRVSRLLVVPGCASPLDVTGARILTVSTDQLQLLADETPRSRTTTGPNGSNSNGHAHAGGKNGHAQLNGEYKSRLIVPKYLEHYGQQYRLKPAPDSLGRTSYVLAQCPLDPNHGGDSAIMQADDGKLSAKCFHNGCAGRGWHAFKDAIGQPLDDHWDPPLTKRCRKPSRNGHAGTNGTGETNGHAGGESLGPRTAYDKAEETKNERQREDIARRNRKELESDSDPFRFARRFLTERCRRPGAEALMTLRFWRGDFHRWDGLAFRSMSDDDFRCELTRAVKEFVDESGIFADRKSKDEEPRLVKVTRGLVADVMHAIKSLTAVPSTQDQPVWIADARMPHDDSPQQSTDSNGESDTPSPARRNLVAMKNLLLDLDAFFEGGSEYLIDHTPQWFSPVCLPYAFDVAGKCPRWEKILQHNLEGDTERIQLLQEFFGYCLTPDTSQQKFLLMVGEGANGKSVACAVLEAMIGKENCAHVPLERFGERFQLTDTLDKLMNIAPEVGEIDKAAEGFLKSFTSGDRMQFDRKHKPPISATPMARLVLATNNLPRFSDRSGGLWRRMILMPWRVTIAEGERIKGMDKPEFWEASGELPGIFCWALEGLNRLRRRGTFTESAINSAALAEYRTENNPARLFFEEHCKECPEGKVSSRFLHQTYRTWCFANGYSPLAASAFGREVIRTFPKVEKSRSGSNSDRAYEYRGISYSEFA